MPLIKIKHISSFSSEDPAHRAENLLSNDTTRKWKCAVGEKQATIVFQLEKSTLISSIDIGNEGSAFIEVLVGRSCNDTVQYQVILNASSFMSLQESRQGSSPNRVRMFGRDKLAPDVAAQKWDLVKLVCTQPFNKRISYGLSFVKFHTTEEMESKQNEDSSAAITKDKGDGHRTSFGQFKIKKEDMSDDSQYHVGAQMLLYREAKRGNLDIDFSEMKERKTVKQVTELIEERKRQKESKRPKSPEKKEIEEKRRKTDIPTFAQSASNPVQFSTLRQKKDAPSTRKQKTDKNRTSASSPKPQTPKVKQPRSQDPSRSTKPSPKKTRDRPFNRILDGVVFALSGFQNPLRGELREKGLGMGAQYRKDWTPDATHLVCAFANTPKFRQVMGSGGKIVRKEWFYDCSNQKRLLSWRKYSMDPNQSSGSSSSEEEIEPSMHQTTTSRDKSKESISSKRTKSPETVVKEEKKTKEDDPYEASTDEEEGDDPYKGSTDEEAGDTEDEIERIRRNQNGKEEPQDTDNDDDDIYNASTDEEPDNNEGDDLPYLPDFLTDKHFLLYGEFSEHMKKQIRRHLTACGGKILEYMNDDVDYVVTEQDWDSNFDTAVAENASLLFVRPSWIFQCSSQEKIVPYQPHVVSPL